MNSNADNCLYKSQYSELSLEYLYSVEVNLTFAVVIKSYGFCGTHDFCIHTEELEEYIQCLRHMNDSLSGECKIIDVDSDAYILLGFEGKKLNVSGQLGGSYEDNFMKFSFCADQTLIMLLLDALRTT